MNLPNKRLLSISNADVLCLCRLLAHAAVCSGLMYLRLKNVMTQNECKHSQLCLKGLNGQDKPHYSLYFKRDMCVNTA